MGVVVGAGVVEGGGAIVGNGEYEGKGGGVPQSQLPQLASHCRLSNHAYKSSSVHSPDPLQKLGLIVGALLQSAYKSSGKLELKPEALY